MEEITLWIMGLGPVVVNHQFVKDISRRNVHWTIDDTDVPLDPRDALQLLYEYCGNKYYLFSKYMNQTMGNMMFEHVRQMHWRGVIRQVRDSYIIDALTEPFNIIYAQILFDLYDDSLKRCGRIHVISYMDLDKNQTVIKVKRV